MYAVLKNYLTYGTYYLDDAMGRIDYAVARGLITVDEATELTDIAEQRASAPSAAEAKIAALEATVEAQQVKIAALEATVNGTSTTDDAMVASTASDSALEAMGS